MMTKKIFILEDVPWEYKDLFELIKNLNFNIINNQVYNDEMQNLRLNINNHYLSDDLNDNEFKRKIDSILEIILAKVEPKDKLSLVLDVRFDARLYNDENGLRFTIDFLLPKIFKLKITIDKILILSMYPKAQISLLPQILKLSKDNKIDVSVLRKKIDYPKYSDSYTSNLKELI